MKRIGWAVAGVVLGFVLGGVGPRMDLENLRAERDRLQAELLVARRSRSPGGLLPGMGQLFDAPAPTSADARDDAADDGEDDHEEVDEVVDEVAHDEEVIDSRSPEDMLDEFDIAVDAQRLRAEQSRAALAEQADFSDAQLAQLDAIVDDMNTALAEYGAEMMELALSNVEPEAEQMLGLTHEVTGILYEAQTQVNDLVGEAIDDVDPQSRQIWNHVDLDTFRGAVEELALEDE